MNAEKSHRRRAVYTGLHPYLSRDLLMDALDTWETRHADRPRATLQRFLGDLAHLEPVREQRSQILISLVKAMNAPSELLLEDPLVVERDWDEVPSPESTRAFGLLLLSIFERLPYANRSGPIKDNVRLDLLDSMQSPALSAAPFARLRDWLRDGGELKLSPMAPRALRGLLNRSYVILCERIGPVETDRLLARVLADCQRQRPQLHDHFQRLL